MKQPGKIHRIYMRATQRTRNALKLLLAQLQGTNRIDELTQEEMVCASWAWLATRDPSEIAEAIGPYVMQFRADREPASETRAPTNHGVQYIPPDGPPRAIGEAPPEPKGKPRRRSQGS